MSEAPLVYAIVTNWNGLEDTTECVESILASSYENLAVVIVDNGSTDGCAEILAERFPQVPQVRTGENAEVTAAYNSGLRHALSHDADYLLMLNNDTTLHPEMVSHLVDTAQQNRQIGVLTPKIYYYDRPDLIWFAGARCHAWDFGAYDRGEGEKDGPDNSMAKETEYAWACGMLFSRALLEKIGLFDTRFWLYYDDVDICLRARKAGYLIWYVPEAKMWHKVGESTGSDRFARTWGRSKMLLYRKHATGLHRAALVGYAFGHSLYRQILPSPFSQKINNHYGAYLSGLWEGLGWQEPRTSGTESPTERG
ncbi:MAG: glycosyltransferase family 2 protein [Chloroflexota bacterium]